VCEKKNKTKQCKTKPELIFLIITILKRNCGEDGLIGVCGQPRSQQNGHRGGQMFDNIINAWTSFSSESKLPPSKFIISRSIIQL
jgi:hypothetical protein